jgi:Fic family protein
MRLSYNKLIQYDLLDDAEANLTNNQEKFFEFFTTFQNVIAADRFIRDCPSFPDSNKTIIRDELVSAIGSTLAIEGIVIKEEEIREAIQKPVLTANLQRKQQEALNSRNVYGYIINTVNTVILERKGEFVYKDDYVRNIHRLFTENINYIGSQPGAYRNTSTSFGDLRKVSLCQNYPDIYKAMNNYINWLNQKKEGILTNNIIAKAIMSHYYLTEIHPFGDGNGRTARAVEAMVLYANGINPYCFWSLANFWSARRNEYIAHLGNIRETCDPLDFLIWGAKGYLGEVERIKGAVLKKLKYLMLRDYVSWLLKTKKQQKPEKKINERIRSLMFLLTDSGKIPLDKFRASSEYESLYLHESSSTKSRDLSKMKLLTLDLIRISIVDGKEFIEPNYDVLERLEYRPPVF